MELRASFLLRAVLVLSRVDMRPIRPFVDWGLPRRLRHRKFGRRWICYVHCKGGGRTLAGKAEDIYLQFVSVYILGASLLLEYLAHMHVITLKVTTQFNAQESCQDLDEG